MKYSLFTVVFLVTLLVSFLNPVKIADAQMTQVVLTPQTAPIIISQYATLYGVNQKVLINTLRCESTYQGIPFNPNAIGDNGTSIGIAQIHLPAHPEITKEEALDPYFSIEWAAEQFKKHNQHWWSCYNILYRV